MIVGSGLIANAFIQYTSVLDDVCIYAAGVSNSSCLDEDEFARERQRLQLAIGNAGRRVFVYFSTCSIDDPWSRTTRYVAHKRDMESLVRAHAPFLIVRLPQVAGRTPNPHTLLNHLYARIRRSERFDLWHRASRNVINVDDVASLAVDLLLHERARSETINIANPNNSTMTEIVRTLEHITQRRAICNLLDRGGEYMIDTSRIEASIQRCKIRFDETYLLRTLTKFYA
jgi:nucleoside-diphosphate-sugar epimerase